ncbi:MAG: hypothetical protein HYT07_00535 [Candidatus Levybacteria bacterium]|nr:hypothetical protein [Candidatus Levybacteria bacterium]
MENTSASINLVKKKEPAFLDKFIDWALSVGRLIVIITEIIAIATFLYRFSLDEKLVRLHGEIRQKQAQLSLLKKDEENFRNLQDRLSLASNFSKDGAKVYKSFQDIVSFTPEDLKLKELSLKHDQATIDLDVLSVSSLTEFVNSLRNYPQTKSLSLDNVENIPNVGISVAITALFK